MRLNCFVLVVVFTLAACCQGLSNADGTVLIKSNRQLTSGDNNVERHLKGAKTTATEVADEERGLSKLTAFLEKIPYLNKVKGAVGTGTNSVKIAVAEVREIAKKDKHPAVSVAISLLKMLVFVGVVSVATGYIVYRVTNS